ncbi:MAG: prolipoprotein diacylglyceryl transferase [Candidatus Lernaella stagnicola]|nr:prolipoprotein diacylglyceryl transferase [Candidatus Lernaella stagnicola]
MHPILFEILGHQVRTYSVAMALGFVVSLALLRRRAPYEQINVDAALNSAILIIIGTIVGGRIMFIINTWSERFATEGRTAWEVFLELFKVWEGGLVFYGGFLGSILLVWLYLTIRKIPVLQYIDLYAPYGGLGLAIHRPFGCFLNGCCYGGPTHMPWGVHFPLSASATRWWGIDQALHPTQIYMGLSGLLIFFALVWYRNRKQRHGEVFGLLLMIYAVNRFLVEIVRGDKIRGHVPAFALIFLAVFGAGILLYFLFRANDGKLQPLKWVGVALYTLGGFLGLFGTTSGSALSVMESPFSTSQYIGFFVFVAGAALFYYARYYGQVVQPEYGQLIESEPEEEEAPHPEPA